MTKIIVAWTLFIISVHLFGQQNGMDSFNNRLLSAKNDSAQMRVFTARFYACVFSDPDQAIAYTQFALLLAKERKFSKEFETIAVNRYGYALGVVGNYPEAIKYLLKSMERIKEIRTTRWVYEAYNNIAETYRDDGDYRNANFYLDKWWEYYLEQERLHGKGLPPDSFLAQNELFFVTKAQVEEKANNLDAALIAAQRAMVLEKKFKLRGYNVIPLIMGDVYRKKKNYAIALDFYRRAAVLGIKQNTTKDLMDIYNGMSVIFMATERPDSCVLYAEKTIALRKFNSYRLAEFEAFSILSAVYKSKNKLDSTVKYLELTSAAKDSLFNQTKEREVQSLSFDKKMEDQEQLQALEQAQLKYRSRLFYYALIAGLLILIIVVAGLWRRNLFKQKSLALVHKQKKEIEETLVQLKSTQAQLIQSEKMASLGELTAGIAHEIQNPLNFVNNFSDVNKELLFEMKDEMDKGNIADAKEIANDVIGNEEKINHHGKRADAIVKGMLQHSQSGKGVKEPTDINKLADEYLRLAYNGLRAKDKVFNATLKTDYDEGIGNINIVPQDIGRVLLNLYNNAFYTVKEKSSFQNLTSLYEPAVSVSTKKQGDKVLISVQDNGNGISQNIVDKIFQPFFTTKPTGQGTGLGLSLAYDIVKAHGGEFKVETKEKEGSEFIIQLPTV